MSGKGSICNLLLPFKKNNKNKQKTYPELIRSLSPKSSGVHSPREQESLCCPRHPSLSKALSAVAPLSFGHVRTCGEPLSKSWLDVMSDYLEEERADCHVEG